MLVESGQENVEQLTAGTEKAWHAFHTMARIEVAKKKPQIGERIGTVYAGVREAQPGVNAPVRWRLLVEWPDREIGYSPLIRADELRERPVFESDAA